MPHKLNCAFNELLLATPHVLHIDIMTMEDHHISITADKSNEAQDDISDDLNNKDDIDPRPSSGI